MPKATLTFNLPEENWEFKDAIHGHSYHSILQRMDEWLRHEIKYKDNDKIDCQELRDRIHEEVDGLPFYE